MTSFLSPSDRKRNLLMPRGYGRGMDFLRRPEGLSFYPQSEEDDASHYLLPEDIPPGAHDSPLCVLYLGRRGDGKTLTMTGIARMMKQRYRSLGVRMRLATNYWVDFADFRHPRLVDWLQQFPPEAENLYVCVDEITNFFPSSMAMSRGVRDIGQFLLQIRKRNVEMAFTTQFPQEITSNVLRQIDLFVMCDKWWEGPPYGPYSALHVDVRVFDWHGQFTGYARRREWPPNPEDYDWLRTVSNLHTMFGRYDTNMVIAPSWSQFRDDIEKETWEQYLPPVEAGADDSPPEPSAPAEPQSLEEALARQQGGFNVRRFLDLAQRYEPSIKSVAQFRAWLEAHGYAVEELGGSVTARKAEG